MTQNQGNVIGDRPCVRQSKLFRQHDSGNAMKDLMGHGDMKWDVNQQQGAYAGKSVYDHNTKDNRAPKPGQSAQQPPSAQNFQQAPPPQQYEQQQYEQQQFQEQPQFQQQQQQPVAQQQQQRQQPPQAGARQTYHNQNAGFNFFTGEDK